MQCPVCKDVTLTMSDRQGIEVDYCPQCRGVWLDRGELDKLIERATVSAAPSPARQQAPQQPERPRERRDYDDDYHGYHGKRKKRGFLGEIFDFD